jgi:flavodoxin
MKQKKNTLKDYKKNIVIGGRAHMSNKLEEFKDSVKEFLNNNKEKIILISGCCLVAVGSGLVIDDIKQRNCVKCLTTKNFEQRKQIKQLNFQNLMMSKKIEDLENMCLKKDNFFKKFISDGTKRGDPECARQLCYRKQYLKSR